MKKYRSKNPKNHWVCNVDVRFDDAQKRWRWAIYHNDQDDPRNLVMRRFMKGRKRGTGQSKQTEQLALLEPQNRAGEAVARNGKSALADSENDFIASDSALEDDDSGDKTAIADGYILDFISGEKRLKETPKEQVRQRIAVAICHKYGVAVGDMEADFAVKVGGKRRKKLDIAIFKQGENHQPDTITHVVVCRPEPKVGKKSVRVRNHEQAAKDLKELEEVMGEIESCQHGMWTNGLECFYLTKKKVKGAATTAPLKKSNNHENIIRFFGRCHAPARSPREERRFWAGLRDQFFDPGAQVVGLRHPPAMVASAAQPTGDRQLAARNRSTNSPSSSQPPHHDP